ncbi:MAG TPA: glycoside hydrolase family 95 protein [Ferruginibacter sp.]|nr:glycoside hydrolase family 95 protein [Ferruginibacter sp.]HMP21129.1 glycoside hydrolase family 95 protein [Ferruginibacter sp.]
MKIAQGIVLFFFPVVLFAQQDLKLWYNKPARVWTEALPVGNGRLGAMLFGGVEEELLQLNEATLWSGGPVKQDVNPQAPQYLPQVRAALFNGDYEKANELVKKMQGLFSQSYLPLGDLKIKHNFGNNQPSSYYRELDIQDAIATTRYTVDGVQYKREVFASAPAQVIIMRITASRPKQLNVLVNAASQLVLNTAATAADELLLTGKAPAHADPSYYNEKKEPIIYKDASGCNGMRFALLVKAVIKDGKMTSSAGGMQIHKATEIVLYISAATSFNGFDKCPDKEGKDEKKQARQYLGKALASTYATHKQQHLSDYHTYFNRVALTFGSNQSHAQLPTDERLEAYSNGAADPGLEALYFHYARYLLISSSRTPQAPANLQGIWNKELRPPWSSNYTTNINLQMNYWPAEAGNLPELTKPLFDLIKNTSVTGRHTAKIFYNAPGWVLHHNSDIWALSNPVGDVGNGDPKWANWAMGAQWLCRHLWEHYLYTLDKKFLRDTAYPIMKGAAIFTLNWLVTDSSGHLVTAPSTSPENDYYYEGKKAIALTIGCTMDMGIIRDLFENIIAAGKLLNTDASFIDTIQSALHKLHPFQIGSKGQLLEWYKEFEEVEPHHRHVSHLYALHPANIISPVKTPELAAAAKRTLELRGDDGTGWSLAWKVNFWARLLDGNRAYSLYRNLMRLTKEGNADYNSGGGAYPNLFDAHPPFQIDGNFAGAAGVMEMLLQSQGGELYLLPALPDAWPSGSIKGLKARGAYTADILWNEGKLQTAMLASHAGGDCMIRTNTPVKLAQSGVRSVKASIGFLLRFKAEKGKTYTLIAD